jgi:hypothetical protein
VRVESGRPGTSTAASFPVTDLIGWFGDHHDDAAVTQVTADRARGSTPCHREPVPAGSWAGPDLHGQSAVGCAGG